MVAPYAVRPQVPDPLSVPVSAEIIERVRHQKTLAEALQILAESARLQILIEGNPRRSRIGPPASASLAKDGKAVTTGELITALAREYGYEVAPSGPYLLLTKRYDAPDDFPEVTMEEIRHFLRSVLKMTRQFTPDLSSWTEPDERAKGAGYGSRASLSFVGYASLPSAQWE
jgi:hypothetical protein